MSRDVIHGVLRIRPFFLRAIPAKYMHVTVFFYDGAILRSTEAMVGKPRRDVQMTDLVELNSQFFFRKKISKRQGERRVLRF